MPYPLVRLSPTFPRVLSLELPLSPTVLLRLLLVTAFLLPSVPGLYPGPLSISDAVKAPVDLGLSRVLSKFLDMPREEDRATSGRRTCVVVITDSAIDYYLF